MITFRFSTEDLPKEQKKYYHNTELTYAGGCDDCIDDMIEKFEDFLIAMGYGLQKGEIHFLKEE